MQVCYVPKIRATTMPDLVRFGVSIDQQLLRRFDRLIHSNRLTNRSEAVRDLIRARLVDEELAIDSSPVIGVLTLVYEHSRRELESRLTEVQHGQHDRIISTTHVHIDHDDCLEVVLLRGTVAEVRAIAEVLGGQRGVKHHSLTLTSRRHH